MQPRDVFNKGYKNDCVHGDLDHKASGGDERARVSKNVKHPPASLKSAPGERPGFHKNAAQQEQSAQCRYHLFVC
jgi:hypothetical protein